MTESVREQWERTQKKSFTRWTNNSLRKKRFDLMEDLQTDFETGIPLMNLMNALYNTAIPKHNKNPKLRPHKLDNISQALNSVEKSGIKLHFVKPGQLADHDLKMILGMVWTIIHDYQIKGISVEELSAKEGLLLWCRRRTAGYKGVDIQDFKKSWSDGLAFNALIHSYKKDLLDYEALDAANAEDNLNQAFTVADERLGIPPLLDAEDLIDCVPDERSVMTYVSEFFHKFASQEHRQVAGRRLAKVVDINRTNEQLRADFENTSGPLAEWIRVTTERLSDTNYPSTTDGIRSEMASLKEYKRTEKAQKQTEKLESESAYNNLQAKLRLNGRAAYVAPEGLSPTDINAAWDNLVSVEFQRNAGLRDALSVTETNDRLSRNYAHACKKFNLRVSLLAEEADNAVANARASHTVEAVKGTQESFEDLKKDQQDLANEFTKVQQQHADLTERGLNPADLTDITQEQLSSSWEDAQNKLTSGEDEIAAALAQQEADEGLRVAFADKANAFAKELDGQRTALNGIDGEADEQIQATRSVQQGLGSVGENLSAVSEANDAVEDAGIVENKHTEHSYEGLASLLSNLQKAADEKIKTLESAKLTQTTQMTEAQLAEIKETFSFFDKDNSGGLYNYEIQACMSSLGQSATDEEVQAIMDQWDVDKDGKIEFNEFVAFMVEKLQDSDSSDQIQDAFSTLADGNDFITEAQLREELSDEQVAYCLANMPKVEGTDDAYDYKAFVSNCYA